MKNNSKLYSTKDLLPKTLFHFEGLKTASHVPEQVQHMLWTGDCV